MSEYATLSPRYADRLTLHCNWRPLMPKIHSADDARRLARRRMPRLIYDFIAGAAGREVAARRNRRALAAIRLQPKVLVNTGKPALAMHLLDEEMGLPFGIAPMGMCNLSWPGADQMLARAARRRRIPLCVSMASSTTLEEVQRQAESQAWFQLYAGDSTEATLRMVKRAENAGYSRLILTADVPKVARRPRDLKNNFRVPFRLGARQLWDFALHPRWSMETLLRGVPRMMNFAADGEHGEKFVREAGRGADWAFLDQLRAHWRGKLIVKGVLSAHDALRIKQAGADAVYVSNHGGRQLDSAPPAIEMLPAIRAAVGTDYPLIFDSGARSGEDIVKALALGADFVMLGRPVLYAIGADGERGLTALLDVLVDEIGTTMAQLGIYRAADLDSTVIVPQLGPQRDSTT